MAAPLPLAAGLDWLEGILPLLFLLFWIVSQVRALFRGADPGKAAEPAVPRPARRPAPRPPAIDEAREELARQIEEFVRRSAPGGQPARPQPPRRDGGSRSSGAAKPQRTAGKSLAPPGRREPPRGASAGGEPPALGSLGGHATDVARHVHDAFAHEMEHLPAGLARAEAGAPPAVARRPPAADLIAALRDPVTLRHLVLVREVLDRPVDRW